MSRAASSELNEKEQKVLWAFGKAGTTMEIEELAREAFDVKRVGVSSKTRGNSWVRNSLRKLLRLKLVKGGDRSGKYTRTELSPEDVKVPKVAKEPKAAKPKKERKAAKPKKERKEPKAAKPKKERKEPKAAKPKKERIEPQSPEISE